MATETRTGAPTLRFAATVDTIDDRRLLRVPQQISRQLPSRGQVAVQGTIDDQPFTTVVEPDGRGGHWIDLDATAQQEAGRTVGDSVDIEFAVRKDWPEPTVPEDLAAALAAAPAAIERVWSDITPMARWEWVRWVKSTKNPDTRQRRVEVTISKLDAGKRRPCCFDLSSCTDPDLARSGKLRQ